MDIHTIRDRVAFRTSLASLKRPAFLALHAIQDEPRDVQIEALFITAVALAQGAGLDPHAMTVRARAQIAEAEVTRNPLIESIHDYAKGELR